VSYKVEGYVVDIPPYEGLGHLIGPFTEKKDAEAEGLLYKGARIIEIVSGSEKA
jgi:hypothetical protein